MKKAYNRIEMIGNTYNGWKVLSEAGRRGKIVLYNALCLSCNKEFVVQGQNLRTGRSKTCVECGRKRTLAAQTGQKRSKKSAAQMRIEYLFRSKRKDAVKRGYAWDLSIEVFESLVFSKCYYTGIAPQTKVNVLAHHNLHPDFVADGWITYNGIDRLNSSIGYTKTNCVPCCEAANKAKLSMSESEFYSFISNAFNHLKQEGKL